MCVGGGGQMIRGATGTVGGVFLFICFSLGGGVGEDCSKATFQGGQGKA